MSASLNYDLFDYREPTIPGLTYIPDYISRGAEKELIHKVDRYEWRCDMQRRTQHFGRRYDAPIDQDFVNGQEETLPLWLALYARRLHLEGHCDSLPDRVSINEYLPGQGIAPHIDKGPRLIKSITILSLGSSCVMEFIHAKTEEKITRFLERRSLTVISGEARNDWLHGIPKRMTDKVDGMKIERSRRISIMFRAAVQPKN